jgi:hypothetical protein
MIVNKEYQDETIIQKVESQNDRFIQSNEDDES